MEYLAKYLPEKSLCTYTKCYCEENVWKLCEYFGQVQPDFLKNSSVVFISNKEQMIPLWCQEASSRKEGFIIWDYHVILITANPNNKHDVAVFDLDTSLSFPTTFSDYSKRSLRDDQNLEDKYHRQFRVIPADIFLKTFASDRTHMLQSDGMWLTPPPLYPCISTPNSINNLKDFISMDPSIGEGQILSLSELNLFFGHLKEKKNILNS